MEQFNNIFLVKTLLKYIKQLLYIVIVAGIISALFSSAYFITPKYKSVAILYPSNVSPYSNESQTEQMVQLLQSADIRDKIIDTLDLYKHYKIDKKHPQRKSVINFEYQENLSVSKTEFESIELAVLDENPETAAKIIEILLFFADKKIQNIQKQKALEVVVLNKKIFNNIKFQLDSVDTLVKLYGKRYGLLDYGTQTLIAQKAYFKSSLKNNGKVQSESKLMLNNLVEHGYDFMFLTDKAMALRNIYAEQEREYYKSLKDYEKVFTYNNIISKAIASDKKAYPVRWLIVLSSMLSAAFLGFLVLLMLDNKEDNS